MRKIIILLVIGAFTLCLATAVSAEWKPEKKFLKMVETNIKGISTSNGPGGGVGNCKVIQRGDADLGWSYANTAYDAYNGRPPFEKKLSKVRYLASLYPGVWQVAVPRSSDIYSYKDLYNKRIVPGKVGFSGEVIGKSLLEVYGITYDSIKKNGGVVNFVGYTDSAALMKDGHLDAAMFVTSCPQATIIDLYRPQLQAGHQAPSR